MLRRFSEMWRIPQNLGEMTKVLECGPEGNKFETQSHDYVHFYTNKKLAKQNKK